MPRLPEPGKDAGQWGAILNEYLSVSLSTDGVLKTDTVGAPQLKPSAVTTAALANSTITSAKLADATIEEAKLSAAVQAKLNAVDTAPVTSVASKTGAVTLNKTDVGLSNVDNTSDANKPISTATQTALDSKQASGSYATTSDLTTKVNTSSVGAANGVASLDSNIKLPEVQLPTRLSDASLSTKIDAAVVPAAAEAMGNPETALNAATVDVVAGVISGFENLVRVERGTLTNIATPRPSWAGVVDWYINEGSSLPLNIAAGDVWTVVVAEEYVPPTPIEIFGSNLVAWWDEQQTPPADGADYGTLLDRATVPHNMVPLTTGMSDVPQFDVDGINGKPAVYQPAVSSMGATIPSTGTGAVTVIIGAQLGAADGTAHYITNGDNNNTPRLSIATNSSGDGWLIRRGGTVRSAGSMVGGRGVPHALIATYDGDNSAFWDNGVKTGGILTPGTIASTTFKVGALQDVAGNVQPAPGLRYVSPIIVNRAITDSEAALVTAFINSRMGV